MTPQGSTGFKHNVTEVSNLALLSHCRATKELRRKKSPAVRVKQEYMSANRTVAKGPNPSLVLGPNRQNLRYAWRGRCLLSMLATWWTATSLHVCLIRLAVMVLALEPFLGNASM